METWMKAIGYSLEEALNRAEELAGNAEERLLKAYSSGDPEKVKKAEWAYNEACRVENDARLELTQGRVTWSDLGR